MMKKRISLITVFAAIFFVFVSGCQQDNNNKSEELNKITVYCDEAVYDMLKPLCEKFDSMDTQGDIILKKSTALNSMARLLSGEANVILLPRDYSHYEDSIMNAFSVKPYTRMQFATDGLVFYVSVWSKLDTLTDGQINEFLTIPGTSLKKFNPKIAEEPRMVCNSIVSSEYFNLKSLVTKGKPIKHRLLFFSGYDSVKNYINEHHNDIGIGYLSQIVNDSRFRAVAISFRDSSGKRVAPRVVHQTNIALKLYPYIVKDYAYIFDGKQDLAMRLGRFLAKYPAAQKYFNDYGIVPAFAKIKLTE